jgi:hypothetical protein
MILNVLAVVVESQAMSTVECGYTCERGKSSLSTYNDPSRRFS